MKIPLTSFVDSDVEPVTESPNRDHLIAYLRQAQENELQRYDNFMKLLNF